MGLGQEREPDRRHSVPPRTEMEILALEKLHRRILDHLSVSPSKGEDRSASQIARRTTLRSRAPDGSRIPVFSFLRPDGEIRRRGEDWVYEIKADGYRCSGPSYRRQDRHAHAAGHDWTDNFRVIAEKCAQLK
jgi:hypothetical protein